MASFAARPTKGACPTRPVTRPIETVCMPMAVREIVSAPKAGVTMGWVASARRAVRSQQEAFAVSAASLTVLGFVLVNGPSMPVEAAEPYPMVMVRPVAVMA